MASKSFLESSSRIIEYTIEVYHKCIDIVIYFYAKVREIQGFAEQDEVQDQGSVLRCFKQTRCFCLTGRAQGEGKGQRPRQGEGQRGKGNGRQREQ